MELRDGTIALDNRAGVPVIEKPAYHTPQSHPRSSLMRLPAELRVKILKELLVAKEPLKYRDDYEELAFKPPKPGQTRNKQGQFLRFKPKVVEGYHLYTAILATCQNLLREGWPILYEDNTLVMGIHFRFNRSNADIPCPNSYCHACAFAYPLDISLMNRYSINDRWLQNEQSLRRASRFRNYKLELDFEYAHQAEYTTVRDMMRYTAPVFLQKSVQVTVLGPTDGHAYKLKSNLQLLRLLRCKQFSINTSFRHGLGSLLCEIEEVVTSGTKVADLQKIMRNLDLPRTWILEKCKGRKDGEAEDVRKECGECIRAMEEAAKDFSDHKFFEARADFLHLFDKVYKLARQDVFKNDTDVGREPEENWTGL